MDTDSAKVSKVTINENDDAPETKDEGTPGGATPAWEAMKWTIHAFEDFLVKQGAVSEDVKSFRLKRKGDGTFVLEAGLTPGWNGCILREVGNSEVQSTGTLAEAASRGDKIVFGRQVLQRLENERNLLRLEGRIKVQSGDLRRVWLCRVPNAITPGARTALVIGIEQASVANPDGAVVGDGSSDGGGG